MADFLDKAKGLRKRGKLGELKVDFDRVFNAIAKLQVVHSKAELDLDNIESVFATFEMARLIKRLPDIPSDDIELLLVSLKKMIVRTLEETVEYESEQGSVLPPKSYTQFVRLMKALNKDREQRCSIITFNYDLALDYALAFHKLQFDYCLSSPEAPNPIPLMKLHGSVNWLRCAKCGQIVPWKVGEYIGRCEQTQDDRGPFVGRAHYILRKPDLSSLGMRHCVSNKDFAPEPVIVPPTWNKAGHDDGLSGVWGRAASELSNAENIFVSGYSLTKTDMFFRHLFALGSVGETRIERFWVFDPDPDNSVESRFRELIGSGARVRFEFKRETFGKAIPLIYRELVLNPNF